METKIITVPLEEGSEIKGSEQIADYLNQNGITSDTEVTFIKGESKRETVCNCCLKTKEAVLQCLDRKQFPLIIGSDHSVSIGSVSAVLQKYDVSVFWIDAHPDINTPEASITKRIHGMPVATLMKDGYPELSELTEDKVLKKENLIYLGVRCFDPYEKAYIEENKIALYNNFSAAKDSIVRVLKKIRKNIVGPVHISFDLDAINPEICPGVNTPVKEGLSFIQVKETLNYLFDNFEVVAMDIVEYNPLNDAARKTVKIISEIVELVKEKVHHF